ncbi:hypothetical protein [Rothia sp. ZJ1223]|uniref:hypothetical protein n=1 Tax=Rothia sp. ZJ1223 TaxID=2811098 RepID=UPI00195F1836|nr:hypothetical protein [Rothia sp. ZJ1223]MBM7052057.1 hypothetical protein [Rothia sp. ZJ1223]
MSSQQPHTPQPPRKYGLRFEELSAEDREFFRPFWEEPAPHPNFVVEEQRLVNARVRMATGLSFTLLMVSALVTALLALSGFFFTAGATAIAVGISLFLIIAVRRRLFKSLRLPGAPPPAKNAKARWFWLPHLLVIASVFSLITSFALVPTVFADPNPLVTRAWGIFFAELGMFGLLIAALAYGLIALAAFSPHDDDERIMRPTDFAEQLLERDLRKSEGDDFYDSDWITGKKR